MPPPEAVIFIVSKHTPTSRRRVLWRVSVDDAKKICSDPRTSGPHYMLCYATTYIEDPTVNIYVTDNGHHDQVLRDHNIRVIERHSSNHVTAQR